MKMSVRMPTTFRSQLFAGVFAISGFGALGMAADIHMADGVKAADVTQTSAILWTRLTRDAERVKPGIPFPKIIREPRALTPAEASKTAYELNAIRISEPVSQEAQLQGHALEEMEGAVPGKQGWVRAVYWPADGSEAEARRTPSVLVDESSDFTHHVAVEGLRPGTRYHYRFEAGLPGNDAAANTAAGSFKTPPTATTPAKITFTVANCQDYARRDDLENGHKIYPRMSALHPDFFIHTGDLEYYDKPSPLATTVPLARFKWNRIFSLPFQRAFHREVANYFMKDDHDTLKDDAWAGQVYGDLTWEQGLALFREQIPMGEKPYRTIRWGRHLQIWLVEGREYRSPNDIPDGPDKSIWGAEQKKWFIETVEKSDATFRIVVSATPIGGPDREAKTDNHANHAFAHEGNELRRFISAQKNMMVICGDRHWQYASIDPETGLREYSAGPSSDAHAGGFSESDRSAPHRFLRIKGGFLSVTIEPIGNGARAIFRHHGVDGEIHYEDVIDAP